MTPEEFHKNNKDGIYLFSSNSCRKCETQKNLMVNVDFKLVECDYDPEFIFNNYQVYIIPCVRVYKNDEVVFEKIGVMDKMEIGELRKYV